LVFGGLSLHGSQDRLQKFSRHHLLLHHGSLGLVNPARRRLVVTILVVFVIGLVVPIVGLTLEWDHPMLHRWWGLVLFFATVWLPSLVVYVSLRRLFRPLRERKAGRTSQGIADHTA
jgi:hypothetical protein